MFKFYELSDFIYLIFISCADLLIFSCRRVAMYVLYQRRSKKRRFYLNFIKKFLLSHSKDYSDKPKVSRKVLMISASCTPVILKFFNSYFVTFNVWIKLSISFLAFSSSSQNSSGISDTILKISFLCFLYLWNPHVLPAPVFDSGQTTPLP